jgi:predicted AAA+ superfamily ATPase
MNIDTRFLPHNSHLEEPMLFTERDPQLRALKHQTYVYHSPIVKEFPFNVPGIYTLGGGRQIGKSTLLKQWMLTLLEKGVIPEAIIFLSGELIDDHHALVNILLNQLQNMPNRTIRYILIDEITYIKDWDKAIKFAADAGYLEDVVLMLTGSDLTLIEEARMRFPGRRGQAEKINFHLYPLSFKEVVLLKNKVPELKTLCAKHSKPTAIQLEILFNEFEDYLKHGGFLTAINDYAKYDKILTATLTIYSDWIRGDILKRNRQEHFLREVIFSIIKRYNTQVSWNSLAKDLSIDHPKTVADYVGLLASMDALFIQQAIIEDKLVAAPKKGKRLLFTDPFIFHALRSWLWPEKDVFQKQIILALKDPLICSQLVEALVTSHFNRFYPTYYISSEGEVDIAYVYQEKFWPIEVKWTNQIRSKDLKQVLKYKNARIFSKIKEFSKINDVPNEPLPWALFQLDKDYIDN